MKKTAVILIAVLLTAGTVGTAVTLNRGGDKPKLPGCYPGDPNCKNNLGTGDRY